MLAAKVRGLEHEHFPRVVEEVVKEVTDLSNHR
jgi:folate-dependent phosphoribosylglycinamide formyltransferase PurN